MERKHLIGGIIFITAMLGAIIFVYPAFLEQRASAAVILESQEALTKQQVLIREVKSIEKRYKKIESDVLRISDLLPFLTPQSISNLFIEIEGIATTNGFLIDTISFRDVSSGKKEKQANTQADSYHVINIAVRMSGLYSDIKRFSTAIETNKHLMDITSLFITAGDMSKEESEDTEEKNEDMNYEILIDAYYQ